MGGRVNFPTPAELATRANDAARLSRYGGAPTLDENASLPTLLEWLAWCDPNGEWGNPRSEYLSEFIRADAWEAIRVMLASN